MLQSVYALTLQNVEDTKSTDVPDGASNVEDDGQATLTREEAVAIALMILQNQQSDPSHDRTKSTNFQPLWSDKSGSFRRSPKSSRRLREDLKGYKPGRELLQLQKITNSKKNKKTADIDTIFIGFHFNEN